MKVLNIILISIFLSACSEEALEKVATTLGLKTKITGNQEVNCLKIDLGMTDEELIKRISVKKSTPDLTLLKRVHLPKNASLCEKRDFIDLILYMSSNQNGFYESHPQVQMIALALKGHEQDFLPMAKDWHTPNSYITKAYIELIRSPSYKEFVRNNIYQYPWLIQVIVKNNWSIDFEKEIIDITNKNNGRVHYHFATAFQQINNPIHKDIIIKSFVNSTGNRHIFYSVIKEIEWLDTTTALKEIWQSKNVSDLELQYLAYPLGTSGHIPVLYYLANNEEGTTYNNPYRENISFFNYLTNQNIESHEMKSWLAKNEKGLLYSTEQKRFQLNSQ